MAFRLERIPARQQDEETEEHDDGEEGESKQTSSNAEAYGSGEQDIGT